MNYYNWQYFLTVFLQVYQYTGYTLISALKPLVGRQEGHPAFKNPVSAVL